MALKPVRYFETVGNHTDDSALVCACGKRACVYDGSQSRDRRRDINV